MTERFAPTTAIASNRRLIESFVAAFWNNQDLAVVEQFIAPQYVDHAYQPATVAGLQAILGELSAAFPDHHSTIEQLTAEEDRVVVRLKVEGTHQGTFRGMAATGRTFRVTAYRTFRIANGQICEHWALFDTAALLRQIGATTA